MKKGTTLLGYCDETGKRIIVPRREGFYEITCDGKHKHKITVTKRKD